MRKLSTQQSLGLVFISAFLFSNSISYIPEILKGFLAGIGIALTLFGILVHNNRLAKLRSYKINLFRKLFRKAA